MADATRFGSLVGLPGSYSTGSGGSLDGLGKFGAAVSALSPLQAAQDGKMVGLVAVSDKAIDGAINSAFGTAGANTRLITRGLNAGNDGGGRLEV